MNNLYVLATKVFILAIKCRAVALLEYVLGAESVYLAWLGFLAPTELKEIVRIAKRKNSNCLGNYFALEVLKLLNLRRKLNFFFDEHTLSECECEQMDSLY